MHDDRHLKASDLLIARLEAHEDARITLRDIVQAFETRGFGFVILIFALPNCLPGPPGIGSIVGIPMAFVAIQLMIGQHRPWLPRWLLDHSLDRAGLLIMLTGSRKRIRWFEALFKPRLETLFDKAPQWLIGLFLIVLAGCVLLPLPLTNFIPAVASAIIGLALIERDGAALVVGAIVGIVGIAITTTVVAGIWVAVLKSIEHLFA